MKKLFSLFITAVLITPCIAQDTKANTKTKKEERKLRISAIAKQEEEGVIKYKKHTAFGLKLTTDGYGGFLEVARAQSVKRSLLFQLDIAERKHPKEEKTQYISQYAFPTSPIIFGKLNFFYPVKIGVQQQFLLGNKGNKNGVSITGNLGGGLIAGLLRPYQIEVQTDSTLTYVKYDPNDTAQTFLNPAGYNRGPGLGKGWNQLKVTPGLYVKTALRFDFGKYNELVNAAEVGLTAEFYSRKIPKMVFNKEKQFFLSAYVSILFGKRK